MFDLITPLHFIFYVFAAIAAGAALTVITAKNPVHCVLALVVTFFAMAGVWMLLHAEFLSIILVLVYVGAVMTLFLFVVMMLNIDKADKRGSLVNYWPFGMLLIILIMGMLIVTFSPQNLGNLQLPLLNSDSNVSNITQLGNVLYTVHFYPFQIAGVILLTAIIAAIILAYRPPHRRKMQNPSQQIAVDPKDRLILVKMVAEKKIQTPAIPKDSL